MSTLYYRASDLPNLVAQGDIASATGAHALWMWAKANAKLNVTVAGESFEVAPMSDAKADMAWRRVGQVALEKGKRFRVAITAERAYFDCRADLVGAMALSPDPGFDPAKAQAVTRVLGDQLGPVQDARVTLERGTHTHFAFPKFTSPRQWEARAAELRQHILVSAGLWPLPERCPLNPRIFDKTEREDYSVEKVYFESCPGFFVTGNLYRPKGRKGPFPGLANPHGHWPEGRFADDERGSVPGRCINFAKQGYVAFSYDMVGYNDSLQVPHRFQGQAEELWGINMLGLQLWNSLRVVDFLVSLPDVESERIGCTGTSGGGTQTFMLMGIEPRVKVAAPVCMVSGIMQGGCICENAPLLRLDTYNAEIAALMAPRPLLLVAATGDWTRLNPDEEYPGIRSVYELYRAAEKVKCIRFRAEHNYNRNSREAVYQWFARWLLERRDHASVREVPFAMEKRRDLVVFPDNKLPAHAADTAQVMATIIDAGKAALATRLPEDKAGLAEFRKVAAQGLRHAVYAAAPKKSELCVKRMGRAKADGFTVERLILGRRATGDQVPAVLLLTNGKRSRPGVVVVHPEGKAALFDPATGRPNALVQGLLAKGRAALVIDAFLTGEHHAPFEPSQWDTSETHFWTFHRKQAAEQVQDVLTAAAYLRSRREVSSVSLVGCQAAGLWCMFAAALDPEIAAVAMDADQFANTDDNAWVRAFDVPSIRRVGDVTSAASLLAPRRLLVHNAASAFDASGLERIYSCARAQKALTVRAPLLPAKAVVAWLAQQ